jgi:Chitin synthase export chaperone
MGISFGSYTEVCDTVAMVVCPLLGSSMGLEPTCYSRNVEINSTVIFQPGERVAWSSACLHSNGPMFLSLLTLTSCIAATCVIHIAALVMTAVMVYHIRSKYTAVGESSVISRVSFVARKG